MASLSLKGLKAPSKPVAVEWCPLCKASTMCEVETRKGKRTVRVLCNCEAARRDERDRAWKMQGDVRREEGVMSACFNGFPSGRGSFDADDGRNPLSTSKALEYASRLDRSCDRGIVLYGDPRSGKTFLAEAIATAAVRSGMRAIMRTAAQLVEVRQHGTREQASALLAQLSECDLLVIDDLGAERSTEFAQEVVLSAVDGAYAAHKPMVVTTNEDPDVRASSADVVERRLWGRIMERCEKIKV